MREDVPLQTIHCELEMWKDKHPNYHITDVNNICKKHLGVVKSE